MRSLSALLLLAAVAPLAACSGGGLGEIGSTKETFDGPFDGVVAQTATGRIEFLAGDGDSVDVEFLPNGSDTWSSDEEGTLTLIATCLGDEEAGCGGGFIITIPADIAASGDTDTSEVDFGPGLTGELSAQTASGAIGGADLGAASLTALTGTGAMAFTFGDTPRAVDLDSGSSNIEVTLPSGAYALDIDTQGESTVEGLDDDPNGPVLKVHSGTGNIGIVGS